MQTNAMLNTLAHRTERMFGLNGIFASILMPAAVLIVGGSTYSSVASIIFQ